MIEQPTFHSGGPTPEWVQQHMRVCPDGDVNPELAKDVCRVIEKGISRDGVVWMNPETDTNREDGARIHGTRLSIGGISIRYAGRSESAFFRPTPQEQKAN